MTKSPSANIVTGTDLMGSYRQDLTTGTPPVRYAVGTGAFADIQIVPGRVSLWGGPPNVGKTAIVVQLGIDLLRLNENLKLLICNVEMPPAMLLERQVARLSAIDLTLIQNRKVRPPHHDIDNALDTLDAIKDRLCFMKAPFDLQHVTKATDEFADNDPVLVILDYIQRVPPVAMSGKAAGDPRQQLNRSMDLIRQIADAGAAVIVVSAVGRTRDDKGRESSELEYGADDAYILHGLPGNDGAVRLSHLKSRYGQLKSMDLEFHGAIQRFTPITGLPARSSPPAVSIVQTLRSPVTIN